MELPAKKTLIVPLRVASKEFVRCATTMEELEMLFTVTTSHVPRILTVLQTPVSVKCVRPATRIVMVILALWTLDASLALASTDFALNAVDQTAMVRTAFLT